MVTVQDQLRAANARLLRSVVSWDGIAPSIRNFSEQQQLVLNSMLLIVTCCRFSIFRA